jgi:hypothetical protein
VPDKENPLEDMLNEAEEAPRNEELASRSCSEKAEA